MRIVLAVVLSGAAMAALAQQPIRGQVREPQRDPQGQEAPRAPRQPQRIVLVDRIVAVVGREVVTASELAESRGFAERQLRQQGTPLPERGILERQILERLILDKAQLQLAKENGIRVEEVQLDRALERIAENNKLTLSAFRQALEKDGVQFDKFRDEVRQQIQLQRLREREVDDRIEVSESEIEQFLAASGAGATARSEFNLAHVLVRL